MIPDLTTDEIISGVMQIRAHQRYSPCGRDWIRTLTEHVRDALNAQTFESRIVAAGDRRSAIFTLSKEVLERACRQIGVERFSGFLFVLSESHEILLDVNAIFDVKKGAPLQ